MPRGHCRPGAWRRKWKSKWPSGCWRRGIDRNFAPSVNFEAVLVQLVRDLGLVSPATPVPDSTKVRAHTSDQGQLPCALDSVQAGYGYTPNRLLANAGYRKEQDLQELETRGIDGYVATGREGHTASGRHPPAAVPKSLPSIVSAAQSPMGND